MYILLAHKTHTDLRGAGRGRDVTRGRAGVRFQLSRVDWVRGAGSQWKPHGLMLQRCDGMRRILHCGGERSSTCSSSVRSSERRDSPKAGECCRTQPPFSLRVEYSRLPLALPQTGEFVICHTHTCTHARSQQTARKRTNERHTHTGQSGKKQNTERTS